MVTVAGVEVSPDHWIDGERLASAATFPIHSPVDGSHLGDIAAGDASTGATLTSSA